MSMGEEFKKVCREFIRDNEVAGRTLARWAGYDSDAQQRWLEGRATPEEPAFKRMLEHISDAGWRRRFQDAWDEDNTPAHIWRELQELRARASAHMIRPDSTSTPLRPARPPMTTPLLAAVAGAGVARVAIRPTADAVLATAPQTVNEPEAMRVPKTDAVDDGRRAADRAAITDLVAKGVSGSTAEAEVALLRRLAAASAILEKEARESGAEGDELGLIETASLAIANEASAAGTTTQLLSRYPTSEAIAPLIRRRIVAIVQARMLERDRLARSGPSRASSVPDVPSPSAPPAAAPPLEQVVLEASARVRLCHACDGKGSFTCDKCHGSGLRRCSNCYGDGKIKVHERVIGVGKLGPGKAPDGLRVGYVECVGCKGVGGLADWMCEGTGRRTCATCGGSGKR